jgi:hypothetical protein
MQMARLMKVPLTTKSQGSGFEPLDISVLRADSDQLWVSAFSRQGEVHGVPRALPTFQQLVGVNDHTGLSKWFGSSVLEARDARSDALLVGRELTNLLFDVPEIASLTEQTRGVAASAGAQLLVRLLAAPSDIAAWPWELLVDPQHPDSFLAMSRDVHLVRTPRARTYPARQARVSPPLQVLLVLSSPMSSGPAESQAVFDLYAEKRALLAELQPMVERGLLEVTAEVRPSVERLRSRMARQRLGFHVVHYLGHAQPHGLQLEEASGRARLVQSAEFSRLLQELPDLRLIVFAGCETARAPDGTAKEPWPGMLSTTDHCVRDASPAVVGMQAVLPFATEKLFTRFFYQSLTAGRSIADSLRLARLAVEGDDQVGGNLLDWAVPCLVVGGGHPGALLDPSVRLNPPGIRRRASLRLDSRQSDLAFFARQTELREVIDTLEGHNRVRLVQIVGGTGTGKSMLLERAVEEVHEGVARLALSTNRLLTADEPVEDLCQLVEEVLRLAGKRTTARGRRSPMEWWERLLEDLSGARLAIALDDADGLHEARAESLLSALKKLVQRRGETRIAVALSREVNMLWEDLPAPSRQLLRLQPLAWPEVWSWIRRNVPVLTRFGSEVLSPYFADLGTHLEQWSELGVVIATRNGFTAYDLPDLVQDVVQRTNMLVAADPAPPATTNEGRYGTDTRESSQGPLRVAIAGPHTVGRTLEFSRALTSLAASFGLGGRMVTAEAANPTSTLGQMVDLASPFDSNGRAKTSQLFAWLNAVVGAGADVVLLDFGASPSPVWESVVGKAEERGLLLIAAGGNEHPKPSYPAWIPSVLAVGAIGSDGNRTDYSTWEPQAGKPDLFAPETTDGTLLAKVPNSEGLKGTSFAALHAVFAAILVWATDRRQTASMVKEVLIRTSEAGAEGIRVLNLQAALTDVRRRLLLDALEEGPLETGMLVTKAGLRPELALPIIEKLQDQGTVQYVGTSRVKQWERVISA